MQPSRLGLLLLLAAHAAACSVGPTTAIASLPPPIGEAQFVPAGPGQIRVNAVSGQVVEGQRYHFEVMTHCGFQANSFDFDGSFWTVQGPGSDGNGNPPQNIGNPSDAGVIQLIGPNATVWTSASGVRVNLERGALLAEVFLCY